MIDFLTLHIYYPIVYTLRKHPLTSVSLGLFITFTLSGWWHGNHIGYILWGAINASYLLIEYFWKKQKLPANKRILGTLITFFLISGSNFFFKARSWGRISEIIKNSNQNDFFPTDWMIDFVAIIGNGGHFIQQYNLLETAVLVFLFFLFEKQLNKKQPAIHSHSFTWFFLF